MREVSVGGSRTNAKSALHLVQIHAETFKNHHSEAFPLFEQSRKEVLWTDLCVAAAQRSFASKAQDYYKAIGKVESRPHVTDAA